MEIPNAIKSINSKERSIKVTMYKHTASQTAKISESRVNETREKRRRTREVEFFGRVKPESTPRREKRSRHRRHGFRPRLWSIHVSVALAPKILCCRGRRRRQATWIPKWTQPKKLHARVWLVVLVFHDRHASRRNLRYVAVLPHQIRALRTEITTNFTLIFRHYKILCLWKLLESLWIFNFEGGSEAETCGG